MFEKHWIGLLILPVIVLLILIFSCTEDPVDSSGDGDVTVADLSAVHISPTDAPVVDGRLDDTWSNAEEFVVAVESTAGTATTMSLRALTDSVFFYMMVQWSDSMGDVRPNSWWQPPSWVRRGGQDFFVAIFADDNNGDIGADCWQMCHDVQGSDVSEMRNSGTGIIDAWLWKSGQTNPVGRDGPGTLEDMSLLPDNGPISDLTVQTVPIWQDNRLDLNPRWMHQDSIFYTGAFLYMSEAIAWKSVFGEGPGSIVTWPPEAVIPGYVLADSVRYSDDESRWEVETKGISDDEYCTWTLEIKRKLDTGHGDDIPFVLGSAVECTVGFTSSPNSNRPGPHYGSEPFIIGF